MYIGGDGISSEYVGDLQGINNIEADAGWRLYEMWTELAFGSRSQTTLRAGVLDMNAEFDTPETTGLFVASPHGIGTDLSQSGSAGPSVWPTTGLGIRAAGAAENGFAWRVGLYDGAPGGKDGNEFSSLKISSEEGALAIGELVYSSEHVNKISLGAWGYSARFERIDAELQPDAEPAKGNHGFYTLIDLPLGSAGDARFDGALRMGTASKEFNPVDRYVGLAFTTSGFSAARPDDAFGVAVAYARLGEPYRAAQEFSGVSTTSAEITWEFNYTTPLTPWLALMPGVQFVQHPGADASLGDAWVVGLRFDVSHGQSWRQTARRETPAGDPVASLE
jgi:porin